MWRTSPQPCCCWVWIALLWAADLCMCETRVKYARGVVEDPIDGLPMSVHGVCCNAGHLRVHVDAARLTEFLHGWVHCVCDGVPHCICRYLVCGERGGIWCW